MMNVRELISQLQDEGFSLACEDQRLLISPADRLTEEIKQVIRENKAAILDELARSAFNVTVTPEVTQQPRYIVTVEDATTDPVIVNVAIAGLASFDLAIPHAKYDGMAIIDAIERYSTVEALSDDVALSALTDENEPTVGLPDEQEREAA